METIEYKNFKVKIKGKFYQIYSKDNKYLFTLYHAFTSKYIVNNLLSKNEKLAIQAIEDYNIGVAYYNHRINSSLESNFTI